MNVARWRPAALAAGACLTLAVALPGAAANATAAAPTSRFVQTNLVSDVPGWAEQTDANLKNPWGASYRGASPLWVSDTNVGLSTLYAGGVHGTPQTLNPLVVSIPGGLPTGQVSNLTTDFVVHDAAGNSGPAFFLFAGLTGHLTGWNPAVGIPAGGAAPSTNAQDAKVTKGASYTGLAMGTVNGNPRLYAANFGAGQVEMYGGNWGRIQIPGAFHDGSLPKNFAPFNVMVSGSKVYVAYALRGADGRDVAGAGLGRVDVFTLGGQLIQRMPVTSGLDAPWGLTIAPAGFGDLAGDLIVGNFGNGRIHAFNPNTLGRLGTLRDDSGQAIAIDGLWTLMPGNGTEGGTDELLFTAGPDSETHGLLGTLSLAD